MLALRSGILVGSRAVNMVGFVGGEESDCGCWSREVRWRCGLREAEAEVSTDSSGSPLDGMQT